ncbi:hypothetical protein QC763_606610 [Podospora pseudopauciseta]|uniref:CHAT domain-containing protein n=1 Tax=Podospora pseudopauciseta TaxID=2093780 RepID=A0ABR0H585_9PEZI|nr:hypothetical protein QC763_606610 [Podospora pseudopauciseta]
MDAFWENLSNSMTLQDIEYVLERFQELFSTRQPHDSPSMAYLLSQESLTWQLHFAKTMDSASLQKALETSDAALCHLQHDGPNGPDSDKSAVYESVANSRYAHFQATGSFDSIKAAIDNCIVALNFEEAGTARWSALAVAKLSIYLMDRVVMLPTQEHVSEAVEFFRKHFSTANKLSPTYHAQFLSRFSVALFHKCMFVSDEPAIMEEALKLGYRSIDIIPPEAATMEYTNCAGILQQRFQQTLQFNVLEHALQISRLAVKHEASKDVAEKAGKLTALGNMLVTKCQRYIETKSREALQALEESIQLGREAVRTLQPIDPSSNALLRHEKSHTLTLIAPWFALKSSVTGDLRCAEEGIGLLQQALTLTSDGHPARHRILTYLAHILETQHQILKGCKNKRQAMEKLDEALRYGREAAEATPELDPARGERYMNVGKMLLSKWLLNGDDQPEEDEMLVLEARKHFCYVANLASAPLLLRLPATIQGARLHLEKGEVTEAHQLLQTGISLLPSLHPQILSAEDLRATLSQVSGLSTLAASVTLEADKSPFDALMFLEAGRCIISGLSMSLKTDMIQLQQRDKGLADSYENLRKRLAAVSRPSPSALARPRPVETQQEELLQQLSQMEGEIRKLKGFETFQLPLSEEMVKELAQEGPIVVINVTYRRSDAIIITPDEIKSVQLKHLKYEELDKKVVVFEKLGNGSRRNVVVADECEDEPGDEGSEALYWLWNVAARPILDELRAHLGDSKRVWWITSGLAGRAPLHAAGSHGFNSTENTLSHVISSYISSLKALRYARQAATSVNAQPKRSMLLVTMQKNPPPHCKLDTRHEENVIRSVFGQDMLHLEHPDPELVLKEIPTCSFVHFACHGASFSSDPSRSGLLLIKDGKAAMLTVAQLEEVDTEQAAVAYLSACSTAQQTEGKLADEAIHLGNTFQALGFQHVIGTMWGANDKAAGDVAKRFYAKLTSAGDIGVAQALHQSMLEYRSATTGDERHLLAWCPFIHIGA